MGILTVIDLSKKKIELEYPCTWAYKIIGYDERSVKNAIVEVVLEKPHTVRQSNKSQNGKYESFNLELIVSNEDERIFIYESLRQHRDIKMVL